LITESSPKIVKPVSTVDVYPSTSTSALLYNNDKVSEDPT